MPWRFPFVGAFVPLGLVQAVFDRKQMLGVFKVVGVSLAPFFWPCPAARDVRIPQRHHVVYVQIGWICYNVTAVGIDPSTGLDSTVTMAVCSRTSAHVRLKVTGIVEARISTSCLLASDPQVTAAIARGADITKLGVTTNTFGAPLVTQPDIQSIRDLKGKVLGIGRGKDASYVRLVKLLRDNGINPNDEVKFLAIGQSSTARLKALKAGVIQSRDGAVSSSRPSGDQRGLKLLAEFEAPTPAGGISTTGEYLKQNRPLIINFLKGYMEGIHCPLTQKEKSLRVLARYLRNPDMSMVGCFYDEIARRMEKDLRPKPESIRFLNELVALEDPNIKQLGETDHWGLSLIEEIRRSGFLKQLYMK